MLNYHPLAEKVFCTTPGGFHNLALEIFRIQYDQNSVYREYVDRLGIASNSVKSLNEIPFLPAELFRTHQIISDGMQPERIFSSSTTTGGDPSRHLVADISLYERSFLATFRQFYGEPSEWVFLCLLPSYLEREGASLVYMAEQLIRLSGHPESGFFLHDLPRLSSQLQACEKEGRKTMLLGVTYALLDLAEQFRMPLKHTVIMETGGMKGRREELIREEVHELLQQAFGVHKIHSEYGMTELLSQAYSSGNGIFRTPAWMKVFAGDLYDPLEIRTSGRGILHIIDLANLLSCSFIATRDIGEIFEDGSFRVLGRSDNSDIRGCNLMVASP